MPDSKRFLHPETIQRISRLELRARHVVEGFLTGLHRSPYFGQSVEFLQHREYAIGDDLRYVDWKVWSRHDRLVVKQFEEETNLRCTLLVDVSNSMAYGRGPLNKYEYACTLASCLAYLVLRQHDAVGCLAFDDRIRSRVPSRSRQNHILSVVESLAATAPRDKTGLDTVLHSAAEILPRRGMVVLVSDLLADVEGTLKGLKLLRQQGHDVLVFHILDDDELEFPFAGPTRFEGLESVDYLNCNPRALRDGYLEALHEYLGQIRRGCGRHKVDYALIQTSQPLDAALTAFLSNRLGMHHGN